MLWAAAAARSEITSVKQIIYTLLYNYLSSDSCTAVIVKARNADFSKIIEAKK